MSKIKVTVTTHRLFVLEEDEVERVLQEYAASRFDCRPEDVTISFDISSEGRYVRSVTFETESTLTRDAEKGFVETGGKE